jgi:GT2 family glycosyltransferase
MLTEPSVKADLVSGSPPPSGSYDADIIILALNRFDDTCAAVQSALRQSASSVHVFVLDQGSDPAVRAKFAASFRDLPALSYYVTPKNLGVAGGRNLISSLGKGRIIIGLDNDAVFEDTSVVARAIRAFDDPFLGAIGFRIMSRDGDQIDGFSWGYPVELLKRSHDRFDSVTFVGAGHAIRRATWSAAGGYDSTLFFTWEEYDFCLRAISLGWIVRYDGSLGVIHKVSPEARIQWNADRTRLFVRNRLLIGRRWNQSWISLMPRLGAYFIRGLRGRSLIASMRGWMDAVRNDRHQVRTPMSFAMQSYLYRNDSLHRGTLFQKIWSELSGQSNRRRLAINATPLLARADDEPS